MRRQDEILAQYPGSPPPARRVLLDLAGDLGPVHDSKRLAAFLAQCMQEPDPWTRALASTSYFRFTPGLIAQRFNVVAQSSSKWSGQQALPAAQRDTAPGNTVAGYVSFIARIAEVIPALEKALKRPDDPGGTMAALCLSQIPTTGAVDCLARALQAQDSLILSLALAASGTEASRERYLEYLSRQQASVSPQALIHLGFLQQPPGTPGVDPQVLRWLTATTGSKADAQDHIAAKAIALWGHPEATDLAQLLSSVADPLVKSHLLIALRRAGAGLFTAIEIYNKSDNAFVKTLAVRAAGGLNGAAAEQFLQHVVQMGDGNAQALAAELAIQRNLSISNASWEKLLGAKNDRLRLNAAIVVAHHDPKLAFSVFKTLLSSGDSAGRASGAFALAYIEDPASTQLLARLMKDPSALVRMTAVASLAQHKGAGALAALQEAAAGDDEDLAIRALEGLAVCQGDTIDAVAAALVGSLSNRDRPLWKAQAYRTLGALHFAGVGAAEGALVRGLETSNPIELAGCVEGMAIANIRMAPEKSRQVLSGPQPEVRARRAVGQVLEGDLTGIDELVRLLQDPNDPVPGAVALWEILQMVDFLDSSDRLAALSTALICSSDAPSDPAPKRAPEVKVNPARATVRLAVPDAKATVRLAIPEPPSEPSIRMRIMSRAGAETDTIRRHGSSERARLPPDAETILSSQPRQTPLRTRKTAVGYFKQPDASRNPAAGKIGAAMLGCLLLGGASWWGFSRRELPEPPVSFSSPSPESSGAPASPTAAVAPPAVQASASPSAVPEGTGQPPKPEVFTLPAGVQAVGAGKAGVFFESTATAVTLSLSEWRPGQPGSRVLESQLNLPGCRVSGLNLYYVVQKSSGPTLVIRNMETGAVRNRVLDGVTEARLLFVAPDQASVLVKCRPKAQPALDVLRAYSLATPPGEPLDLSLLQGSHGGELRGVLESSLALISCGNQLGTSLFDPLLSNSRPLDVGPGWTLSREAGAVPHPILADEFLGPVVALTKPGPPPEYKLVACGDTKLQLPADDQVLNAVQFPSSDTILVKSKSGTALLRPRAGTAIQLETPGPVSGGPQYWKSQQLLVWQEAQDLVAYDPQKKKTLKLSRASGLDIVPGAAGPGRFLLASRKGNGADLHELRVDQARTALQTQQLECSVSGTPLFSICSVEDNLVYVVVKRGDGKGVDLVAVKL